MTTGVFKRVQKNLEFHYRLLASICDGAFIPVLTGLQGYKEERDKNISHFILSHMLASPQAEV